MGTAGVELKAQQELVEKVLKIEEDNFSRTLERGLTILNEALDNIDGNVLDGETVFKLYDTYGFPADLTNDVARERGFSIDEEGFETAMAAQRQRARDAGNFGVDYNDAIKVDAETEFCGYSSTDGEGVIVALYRDGNAVDSINAGENALVVLSNTPFYAESGGQCGDSGLLTAEGVVFNVADTQKFGAATGHKGQLVEGSLTVGQQLTAAVDSERRQAISLNHSATHLMHAALRTILGDHVSQKGSLVKADSLRFDFSNLEAVKPEQLRAVENMVNEQIRANHSIDTNIMDIEAAKAKGAMALFGEKYDDQVRVLSMGDFSTELCGGVHATRTGDIGLFKILSESGIAAGIRRIEAVTGAGAIAAMHTEDMMLAKTARLVKSDVASVVSKVDALVSHSKQLEKEIQQLKDKLAAQEGASLINKAQQINGVNVLIAKLDGADNKALRGMVDELKNQLGSGVVLLGNVSDGKVRL